MTRTTGPDAGGAGSADSSLAAVGLPVQVVRELAVAERVCVRPVLRRVIDRQTGAEDRVAIPCGSTREAVCPPCAHKARLLRMQQCAAGWHRTDEPEPHPAGHDECEQLDDEDQVDQELAGAGDSGGVGRRVRSTRRRQDAPDLPQVPVEDRTVGRVFTTPEGREYRPSMFLTLTLDSYGPVRADKSPRDPDSYDYRRAAWDAICLPRLLDRFVQNLRRCAGYRVQYFAAIEPQRRLAGHAHLAIRGAIPRAVLRQVVAATYVQLWWPACDQPVYVDERRPVWDGQDYCDPDTGEVLPCWADALDHLEKDQAAGPVHVARFGGQLDVAGIIAPSEQADRAVRYLTKYLTKSISDAHADDGDTSPAYVAHVDRLHAELRWLPCSERCANWLRHGIQPKGAGPGLIPGRCLGKAHDRENLGLGGRRVLVSRQWSGQTLQEHRADRATVVREVLLAAGIVAPDTERMAADVTLPDGSPRFVWTDTAPDPITYRQVLLEAIAERQRWRAQYEAAKTTANTAGAAAAAAESVDNGSATAPGGHSGGAATIPRPPP